MKISTLSLLLVIVALGCSKDDNNPLENDCPASRVCDKAVLAVTNNTPDTLFFCWGCNWYEDTLLPGGVAYDTLGDLDCYSSYTTTFFSDKVNYAIDVDECNETFVID